MSITALIAFAAIQAGVHPELLQAICHVETRHQNVTIPNDGRSPSYGPCQIKLGTARMFYPKVSPVRLQDPRFSVHVAAIYLRHQLRRYHNHVWCAVLAYNRGSSGSVCALGLFDKSNVISNARYVSKVKQALKGRAWKPNNQFSLTR